MTDTNTQSGWQQKAVAIRQFFHNLDVRLSLYGLLPDKYTDRIETEARYARLPGFRHTTASIILMFVGLVGAALLLVNLPLVIEVGLFGLSVPASLVLPYVIFTVLADRRRKSIERVLPDALLLMSANIESGLTVDKAFLMSARDEFGPLADDVQRTAMKMFGGTPVEEALEELAEDTNSGLFAETLKLLVDGINSGGEVSQLLESSAEDIRKSLHLREEIAANVKMYSMFILFASMVGAPLMFAVSTYLAETTAELWGGQAGALGDLPDAGPMTFHQPDFKVEFFRFFAVTSLIISNMFAALIISEIKNGSVKSGFKFVPVFTTVAVIMYFIVDIVVKNTLGTGL